MPASPVVASVVATPSTTAPSTGVMKTPTRQGEEVPPSAQANVPVEPPPTVIATRIEAASGVVRIANGGEVYGATCARCHGDNGVGSQQGSALLGASNRWSGPTLLNELTNGHAFTFGFADKLSADELTNVVAYVLASF